MEHRQQTEQIPVGQTKKDSLRIRYQIYMEAEDISQSRIHSSIAFLKNRLVNSSNAYIKSAKFEDESDPDAFVLRFYVENEIQEETCVFKEHAESFIIDLAQILDDTAAAHSFMDLEGEFSFQYQKEDKTYTFRSESGWDYCDFRERDEDR